MKEPLEPSKDDCCNSGCNPCIYDVYEKQLKLFKSDLKNGKASKLVEDNAISQLEYTSFTVVLNLELCPAHNILAFKRSTCFYGKKVFWNAGDHFLVKYNSVGKTCTRAYTPLKYEVKEIDSDFEIIVRKYDSGTVSSYLCRLVVGDETLWRGPYGSFEMVPNKYDRMVMVAQGTGIAPFYSVIRNILNNEDDFTRIVLYFCCSSQETILFRDDLYSLKSYWNFSYSIFLTSASECISKYQEPIKSRRLGFKDVQSQKPFSIKDQFLLCGSPTFMNDFKTFLIVDNVPIDNIILF